MAVAVPTTTNSAWATGSNTKTLTKPVDTVDGDFLVAILASAENGATSSVTTVPPGWTLIRSTTHVTEIKLDTYYKIASGEGASWDWVFSTTTSYKAGAVLRVTGTNQVSSSDDGTALNTATPSFTGGVTPIGASSLFVMAVGAVDATSNTTVSGYAVTTSNPVWTEVCDLYDGNVPDMSLAVAYAIRSEATATGDWTCTYSAGTVMDTASQLMTLPAVTNVTVSPAVITTIASVQAPTVSGGANVSPAVITMSASVQSPTVSAPASTVRNQSKNNASVTNLPKS